MSKMNKNARQIFQNMPGLGMDTAEQFIAILETDDEQFDQEYPYFKEQISKIYATEEYQEALLRQIKLNPDFDVEEEIKVIQAFIDAVNEEDSLSSNKKEMLTLMFGKTVEIFKELAVAQRPIIKVKITKLNPDAVIPKYAHPTDAGADVCAIEETIIEPNETKIVKTGLAVAIPSGYEIQVRPRSGLSLKTGLRVANAPGTIDSDYRGEVGVIMQNVSSEPYTIEKGAKIAQFVISEVPMIGWDEVDELNTTERGEGGYGSTDAAKPQE